MNIKHKTIILRAIEETDLEFCRTMINDSYIESTTTSKSLPVSMAQQNYWYNSNSDNSLRFIIENIENHRIGMIIVSSINWIDRTAEIGIKLINDFVRSTQNTNDACEAILSYVFEELNINCLFAYILEENLFSRKLLQRFGFIEEGILRQRTYKRGTYHNQVVYSLLKRDYFEKKE